MFEFPEQYYVQYGTDPSNLDQITDVINSPMDTSVVNETYDTTLQELEPGIIYYLRVAAKFNVIIVRYSDIIPFITLEQGMFSLTTGQRYSITFLSSMQSKHRISHFCLTSSLLNPWSLAMIVPLKKSLFLEAFHLEDTTIKVHL